MLDSELRELRIEWPETPDLAPGVMARVSAPAPRRRRFEAWQIGIAVAAALIAVVMAVPPARSAVLDWLGLSGVRVEREEPRRSELGTQLDLGQRVTLAAARREAGFELVVPAALGEPDEVYLADDPVAGKRVDFVYRPRDGLPPAGPSGVGALFTQFPAPARVLIEKTAGQGSAVEQITVDGDPALFISGAEHGFAYTSPSNTTFEPGRLAGNTLLVERSEGGLWRLEAEVGRDEAVRIAESAMP